MSTNHTRFWIVALGLTLMMSQTLGQVDQQGSARNGTARFGRGFRMGRGAGDMEATPTPFARQTLRQSAPRFVPQGVRHRVPQDYATIQAAINASNDGDTVLVSEGKYMENIRYQGKAIVVASLYLIDGDTSHIEKTIIDGSGSTQADSSSVVYFINGEDTTSVLCGFTIQGGSGTHYFYGIYEVKLWLRAGGGIFCEGAGARVVRNIITGNRVVAQIAWGGGIEALPDTSSFLPYLILEANRITDNYVEGNTNEAYNGSSGGGGADITVNARIVGNVFERDSVVSNTSATAGGMGLSAYDPGSLPSAHIAGNVFRSNFAFCRGMQQGAYGGGMLLWWTGDVTILDNLFESNTASALYTAHQWAMGGGLTVGDEGCVGYGRKTIVRNHFMNNTVPASTINYGGGLSIYFTLATVSRNRFENNTVPTAPEILSTRGGAGINIHACSFRLENNIFTGNCSGTDGGAMTITGPSPIGKEQVVINNTLVGNYAASSGGGLSATSAPPYLVLLNNIFWNNTASSGFEIYDGGVSLEHVAHCDIKGGYTGNNNINADPAFVAGDPMFHLMTSSPCIESGVDSIQIEALWNHAPVNDYSGMVRPMPSGTPPDIGAHEEQVTMVAYARSATASPLLPRKQLDTIHIRATVENPHQHSISVTAFTKDFAIGNLQDSIVLFNDGLHGDGMANDSTWGGMFVPTTEGVYSVSVRTVDGVAGTTRELSNAAAVATAGPARYVGYRFNKSSPDTVPAPGVELLLDVGIRNMGNSGLITNVTARISALDSLVDYASPALLRWGTLFPGDTVYYPSNFADLILGPDRAAGSTASFVLNISSNGYQFWRDTIRIVLTGVEGEEKSLPTSYALEQNYPNPFNPSTTIRFELPERSHVTLTVFNTLGQQVAVLVQGDQEAGYHEVRFEASHLSSGVYYYRLTAGSFVQTRKLLLLR